MTVAQPPLLAKFIDLIMKVGLNLRPGQHLIIFGGTLHGVDLRLAPVVRATADAAYAQGADFVDVRWWHPPLDVMRLKRAPLESLKFVPAWLGDGLVEHFKAGHAVLSFHAQDPNLNAGIDPERVGAYTSALLESTQAARAYPARSAINWCVVAAPVPEWSASVLPDLPESQREARMWELIFDACRMNGADPVSDWRAHLRDLAGRAAYLDAKQYEALKYKGPDTDLTIGLPTGHVWRGGQLTAENGITFVPNLPTEEIFTLPHRLKVDGQLTSSRPFDYAGNTIDGMTLTFREGRVVEFGARTGEPVLRKLLESDEGSRRLGEVALVPHKASLSRLGVTFHNALFDENAASHLALGNAYPFTLLGGETLTPEALAQRGANQSMVHYDFMVGSAQLDIDGALPGGRTEPVMRSGEWAFKL